MAGYIDIGVNPNKSKSKSQAKVDRVCRAGKVWKKPIELGIRITKDT
jgi:hypothetical protein